MSTWREYLQSISKTSGHKLEVLGVGPFGDFRYDWRRNRKLSSHIYKKKHRNKKKCSRQRAERLSAFYLSIRKEDVL